MGFKSERLRELAQAIRRNLISSQIRFLRNGGLRRPFPLWPQALHARNLGPAFYTIFVRMLAWWAMGKGPRAPPSSITCSRNHSRARVLPLRGICPSHMSPDKQHPACHCVLMNFLRLTL